MVGLYCLDSWLKDNNAVKWNILIINHSYLAWLILTMQRYSHSIAAIHAPIQALLGPKGSSAPRMPSKFVSDCFQRLVRYTSAEGISSRYHEAMGWYNGYIVGWDIYHHIVIIITIISMIVIIIFVYIIHIYYYIYTYTCICIYLTIIVNMWLHLYMQATRWYSSPSVQHDQYGYPLSPCIRNFVAIVMGNPVVFTTAWHGAHNFQRNSLLE